MSKSKHLLCILIVFGVNSYFTAIPGVAGFDPIQIYGEPCSASLPCIEANGMFCDSGLCACKPGMVHSKNKERCLKVALSLDDPCEENVQCTERLGPHSACYEMCLCNADAVPVQGVCERNPVSPDLSCKVDIQCSEVYGDDAVCIQSECGCKAGSFMNAEHKMCFKATGLNEECFSDHECYLPLNGQEQHVKCINNFCRCDQGFSAFDGNNICEKSDGSPSASHRTSPLQSTILVGAYLLFTNLLFVNIFR